MKSKVSTGYFTPQSKKPKNTGRTSLSGRKLNGGEQFDETLFRDFMRCPLNKNAVLKLLSANKEVIKQYKEKNGELQMADSVEKIKIQKEKLCESPIALMRRRALEQMNGSPSSSNRSLSSKNASEQSESSGPIPFEKVLDGTIAYVEVKGPFDEDRSLGVKSVLKSMGCQVREKFTRDVTHVIFKDASYTTFKKAKVKKIHLVSILWVEACRKRKQRQDEKLYPAMKSGYDNESMICSQMQREYEDILRDEYKKNMMQGALLPTTESFINRRRTLMTLSASHETCNSEVVIRNEIESNRNTSKRKSLNSSDMEITHIPIQPFNDRNDVLQNRENNIKSPHSFQFDKRKTICNSLLTSDDSSNRNLISSDRSSNLSSECVLTERKTSLGKTMFRESSFYLESDESFICGRNTAGKQKKILDSGTDMSELKLSTQVDYSKPNKSKETSDLSTSISKVVPLSSKASFSQEALTATIYAGRNSNQSTSTMSSLRLNSEKENCSPDQSSLEPNSVTKSKLLLSTASNCDDSSHLPSVRRKAKKSLSSKDKSNSTTSEWNVHSHKDAEFSKASSIGKSKSLPSVSICARRFSLRNRNNIRYSTSDLTSFDSGNDNTRKCVVKSIMEGLVSEKSPKRDDLTSSADSSLSDDSEIIVDKTASNKEPESKLLIGNSVKSPSHILTDHEKSKNTRKLLKAGTTKSKKISNASQQVATNKPVQNVTMKRGVGLRSKNTSDNALNDLSDMSKKTRKLYNPDNYVLQLNQSADDDVERLRRRKLLKKRKSDEVNKTNPFVLLQDNKGAAESISESEGSSPKTRKSTNKVEEVLLNKSADEQKDLLNYVLSTKAKTPKIPKSKVVLADTPTPRRSTRLIHSIKKPIEVPVTPINRRSTLLFVTSSSQKPKKKVDKTKMPTIVCTKLHRPQVEVFAQIVKKLGKFTTEDEVSDGTTHLIAGEPKRTINMLRAISRGCWILKFEWVLQSLEEGRWLSEEDFEVTDFSPTIQKARLERQAFGSKYTLDVFQNCPPMYVALSTTPRCSDLKELIKTCKGNVVTTPRMAKIIVGLFLKQEDTVCVNETWILDSIMFYKKMPFKERYLLREKRFSVVV